MFYSTIWFTLTEASEIEQEDDKEEVIGDESEPDVDSEDEAPDDIGFHDSKKSVLAQLKTAIRQVDASKARRKVLRKKMDAQYKEQKVC